VAGRASADPRDFGHQSGTVQRPLAGVPTRALIKIKFPFKHA